MNEPTSEPDHRHAKHRCSTKDGAILAMFLDAAILVVIAAARWHQLRHHDQQVAAAQQTLLHLQAAYDQAATEPLAALAKHQPPQQAVERQIRRLRQVVPEHAEQIIEDSAFAALTAALAEAEAVGHDPERLIQQVADQRTLGDARRPARVLTWRIQRLSARPTPSARARAAQVRSTARVGSAAQRPDAPDHTAAAATSTAALNYDRTTSLGASSSNASSRAQGR